MALVSGNLFCKVEILWHRGNNGIEGMLALPLKRSSKCQGDLSRFDTRTTCLQQDTHSWHLPCSFLKRDALAFSHRYPFNTELNTSDLVEALPSTIAFLFILGGSFCTHICKVFNFCHTLDASCRFPPFRAQILMKPHSATPCSCS